MDTLLDFFNKITKVNPTPDISFFYTIVSIVFGAITFVVSLSIIPFQKLSESISGYLYKILLKDKKLIFCEKCDGRRKSQRKRRRKDSR